MNIFYLNRTVDATSYYRGDVPSRALLMEGAADTRSQYYLQPTRAYQIIKQYLEFADMIVVQRPLMKSDYDMVTHLQGMYPNKPFIADYDDDYLATPTWNPGYPNVRGHFKSLEHCFRLFDGFTVSTPAIANRIRKYTNAPVSVIKNSFDLLAVDSIPELRDDELEIVSPDITEDLKQVVRYRLSPTEFRQMADGKRVIAWYGSGHHYADVDMLPEALEAVAKKVPDVIFLFVGYTTWRVLAHLPYDRVFFTPGIPNVERYYAILRDLPIDIALAPVHPCDFNAAKSSLKSQESQLFGIYPIASDFETYESDIRHGLLAGYGSKEWERAILKALNDNRLDEKVRMNQDAVRAEEDSVLRVPQYVRLYEEAREWKSSRCSQRLSLVGSLAGALT